LQHKDKLRIIYIFITKLKRANCPDEFFTIFALNFNVKYDRGVGWGFYYRN
jgi:hypothetical protein